MEQKKNGIRSKIKRFFSREKDTSFSDINYEPSVQNAEKQNFSTRKDMKQFKINGIDLDELFTEIDYELPDNADPGIEKIYNSVNLMFRIRGFYGDPRNAQVILYRLADILSSEQNSESKSKDEKLEIAKQIYIAVQSRAMLINMYRTVEAVINSVMTMYSRVYSQHIAAELVKESLQFIYTHDQNLKEKTLALTFMELFQKQQAEGNIDVEDKYLKDPEYGLSPDKPVFVDGFPSLHHYLDHLCSQDGQALKNERCGSMTVSEIDGPVDIYDLFLPNGKKYMTIYMCLYGNKMSSITPKGLKFSD